MDDSLTVNGPELAATALDLGRRFAAGATLWCLAPEWPEHARHVAVEFVHPVVMGKRALPAVSVAGGDALRMAVRAGDALVIIGPGDPSIGRRAAAWGVMTIAIGSDVPADHQIRVDGDTARFDGTLVLRYHLLWELTHVCLEHPGLLATPNECGDTCITCSDEARVAEVSSVPIDGLASVRTARGAETVDTTLVGDVSIGDLVLVHAGTAIERLDD